MLVHRRNPNVSRRYRGAAPETQPCSPAQRHRAAGVPCGYARRPACRPPWRRDIGGRSGHEQCSARLGAEQPEHQPIGFRSWLVVARGFGGNDGCKAPARALDRAQAEHVRTVGGNSKRHSACEPVENARRFGPCRQLRPHGDQSIGCGRIDAGGNRGLAHDRLIGSISARGVGECEISAPPPQPVLGRAGRAVPQRPAVDQRRQQVEHDCVEFGGRRTWQFASPVARAS